MFNKVIAATIVAVAMTSTSASACGFFTKAIFGGGCNQAEYEEIKGKEAAKKFASGQEEGFYMEGNLAYVDAGDGSVTVIKKQDVINAYKSGKKDGVIALIKDEVKKDILFEHAVDSGEFSKDELSSIKDQLDSGVAVEDIDLGDAVGDDIKLGETHTAFEIDGEETWVEDKDVELTESILAMEGNTFDEKLANFNEKLIEEQLDGVDGGSHSDFTDFLNENFGGDLDAYNANLHGGDESKVWEGHK